MTGNGNSFLRGIPVARRVRFSTPRARIAIATTLIVCALACTGVAWAALQNSHASVLSVSSGSLGAPSSVTAITSDACATIAVSWTAGTNANDYVVQVKVGAGSWTVLDSGTGNVTTITDTTGYTATSVQYRVTSRLTGTSWHGGPATSASLSC